MLLLSLCISEFLTYIILLLSEELVTFLTRQVVSNKFSQFLLEKTCISPLHLKNNFTGHKILTWCFFLLTLSVFHPTLFLLS